MNFIKLIVILLTFSGFSVQIDNKNQKSIRNVNFNPKAQESDEKSQFKQLKEFLAESVNNFKLEFHRSFEESRLSRKQKDSFLLSVPDRGVLIEEHLKVENFSAIIPSNVLSSGPNGPIRMWTVIETFPHTYMFWGHSNGKLVLANFESSPIGSQITVLADYLEKGNGVPFKAHHFLYESFLWIVVAFRSGDREYLAVYQFNPNIRTFHRRQTIETDVKSDFDITSKGITYMAVSSYMRRTPVGQTLQSTLKLYEWRHTQFDFIAEQKTFSATAVKLFHMSGTLYMAVTQNYNRSKSLQIDYYNHFPVRGSHIFLYNAREDEKLTYVQIIENMATNVEHFRVDGSDYLVFVSPNDNSRIYWWAGDQFLIYQDLFYSRGATSVSVIRLPNGEILLALLYPNRVEFYTESVGAKYRLDGHFPIYKPAFTGIKLFSYLQRHYFSVFTFNDFLRTPMNSVWKISLIANKIQDSHDFDPLSSCLLKLEQTLTKREGELKQLTERADKVWVANTVQNLTAPVIVRGRVKVETMNARTLFITNNNQKVPQITNTDIKSRTDIVSNRLDSINKEMNNLVFRSTNQTIIGRIVFAEPISAGHSTIKSIVNRDLVLNGLALNALTDNSLQINGNQVINAHFSFNGLTVDQLDTRGLINNLNISDALLSDWPHLQVVTGTHRYSNLIINSNLLLRNQFGSINGIIPDHFVTKSGANQQINDRKVFTVLKAKNIDVIGTINGRDLSAIANRAVRLNGVNQVMTGQLVMDSPISVNKMKLKRLINRVVNVSEIAFNAVSIYGEQRIAGQKTFRGPVGVLGGIQLGGKVNGIKLSREVITTNTQQVITGNIVFKSLTEFMSNIESNSINGIDLSEDCVRRNGSQPQYVNRKVFDKTLVVLNDISMDSGSTIDNVDPSELLKLVISNKNTAFEAPVSLNRLKVGGNIFAKSVNKFPVNDLPHILWLKTVNQTIRVPVVFDGLIKVRQLLTPNINGFSVPKDFVHKTMGANDVIFGEKTFVDNVVINGNLELKDGKRVNAIDLNVFERQSVKSHNNFSDYIRGKKQFRSIRVLTNVFTANVNGLNISSDILLTNSRQTINSNIRLMSPKTDINGRLEVMSDISVKSTVNNHSLSQFVNDLVLTNRWPLSHQRPVINKAFVVGVGAQHMRVNGNIDGIDINDMKSRVVTLNTKQHIPSHKNFTSETVFRNDIFSEYLNGLKIREFAQKVVLKNRRTIVRGFKIFNGNVVVGGNVDLSGTINGIDVQSLQRRIMSRTRNNVISAPMGFTNDINLRHLRLEAPATIDGLRPDDLALIGHNLRLNGNIVFNRGLSVRTDIYVNKTVNDCDLRQLALNSVLYDTRTHFQSIYGTKQFNNLEVLGNVVINGPLNDIDINRLAVKMLTKTGDQVLTAPLTFENDLIVDRLIVRNLINGRNISLIFRDAVLKSKPQTITSIKTFLKPILANGTRMQVHGYVTVDGLVNGVNVVQLNQTAVRQHSTQAITGRKTFTGKVTFKRDVFIAGALSGVKIPNDLILVNTNEVISGMTRFQNWISCAKGLNVNKLIDGLDLSYFVANRLTLNQSNELIESFLNFTNKVTVDQLVVRKSINNIPINAFVTRSGRHDINGIKTFTTGLQIRGNLHSPGIYNTINVHNLVNRAVSLIRPEVIPGSTEFVTPVSMHHMVITGLLNGYDISDMANFFNRYTGEVNGLLSKIKQQLKTQENALQTQFSSHLRDRSSGIDYFILSQEIYESGERFLIDSYMSSVFNVRPIDSLILWTYKSGTGGQCRHYSSITYKISEKGFITSESIREFGRNIPLNSEKLFGKQDLSLWTNTTTCDSRLNEKSLMERVDIDQISGLPFRRFVTNDKYVSHSRETHFLKDAKLFVSNNKVYVILAQNYDKITKSFHTNSTVMSVDYRTGRWSPTQQLETFGVHSIDVISYGRDGRVFCAVANRFHTRSQAVHSVILEWNERIEKFVINTLIQTSNPSAVIFVETSDGQLYAVFANEKTKLFSNDCSDYDNSLYTQHIHIYRYNGKSFHFFQSIDINGVISLDTFQVSNQTYIAAASRLLGTTFILQLRGYNKFEVIQTLPTTGVENIRSFWSSNGNLHLAIASQKSGQTKILTAVINGSHNVKKYTNIEELLIDSKFLK